MWLRIPLRIWGLLSEELWRLTAITLAALCGLVAFAAGVRPLAEGQLGPMDALRFMGLALIPMLQFTAPFAAGFASTLVYHRFAADNEHLAASAGGVSHRSVLAPALIMGLVLGVIVAGLAHFVIPTFLRSMQELVTRDVARMLVGSIERGDSVELNGLAIHADRAIRGQDNPAIGVTDRIFLEGVVAYDAAPDGSIEAEIAAERAEVLISTDRSGIDAVTTVHMRLEGAVGKQQGQGLGEVGTIRRIGPWIVPNAFEENARFYTFIQLGELRNRPEQHNDVDYLRRRLASELTKRRTERLLVAAIAGESRVVLTDALGQRLAIGADHIRRDGERWMLLPREGELLDVDWALSDGARRRQTAEVAWVSIRTANTAGPALLTVELWQVGGRDATGALRERLMIEQLRLASDPGADLYDLAPRRLLDEADVVIEQSMDDPEIEPVIVARVQLQERIDKLMREITANHHERFALATACFLMTLTGAIIALRLREGMPLQVYLWSFFPALAAVITISGGENAVAENLFTGMLVLWGGVAALGVYTAFEYLRLRRH